MTRPSRRCRAGRFLVGLSLGFLLTIVTGTQAQAASARIQGRIVARDTGEPIGYANLALIPADTTLRPIGGLTNSDGTFLLEAPAGRYALQIRAMSYTGKRIDGVELAAGKLLPFSTALASEAIEQEEIVVEGEAKRNTETAMLQARRRASSVGDAVSAEQVRRAPDKDAAEVLRRVTGMSVTDGKYVFVRGLGERYSSTEVDGVRIATPEPNKRVVPLDLFPANLLENIVVQKTYTADRPAEFGGGDVQVRTKDFPGHRTWSVSVSQGYADNATGKDRQTYASPASDRFGFGARARGIPSGVDGVVLPGYRPGNLGALAGMARSFSNVWSATPERTPFNGSFSVNYGDEFKILGRPVGVIQSWSFSRAFDHQQESQRYFQSVSDTLYDYAVERWTESAQLGGIAGLSWRWSPRHTFHLRGLYTHSAEDEVRTYEGADHNQMEAISNTWLVHHNTRFQYVQRSVLSGSAEGQHDFPNWLGANLDWKVSRSQARREQPDRRELTYNRRYYFEGDTAHWTLGSNGLREFGRLHDDGWGNVVKLSFPYQVSRLGKGKIAIGWDRQTKQRDNAYRRFNVIPNSNLDRELPPDSIFAPGGFDGSPETGYLEDATLNDPLVGVDNYRADQRVSAGFVSVDVSLGARLRGNVGVRVERGTQNVSSFPLFQSDRIVAKGELDNTDWLPTANVTWSMSELVNLRLAASRTISRPDLSELSPSPSLEYIGGLLRKGNPNLERARITNYDFRLEAFPSLSEVFAAGVFYKQLDHPIEQVILPGTPLILAPDNSEAGHNVGVELEARASLGRIDRRLSRWSINSNASFIKSEVELERRTSNYGSLKHPLQGQARHLFNAGLTYATAGGTTDVSLLVSGVGRRLVALGVLSDDIYEQASTGLDAAVNFTPLPNLRAKLSAKNLLDPRIRQLQGEREQQSYRRGRGYAVALSYGL